MAKKIAMIIAGCGHQDGSEIREAILALLALDRLGADVDCYAPNIEQVEVINHLTGVLQAEKRNVLIEAARISRGEIGELKQLNQADYDGLILPGGFGMAKNLSNIATQGAQGKILLALKEI